MLPVVSNHTFTSAGLFSAVRKHDVHTGVDFYCDEGSPVRSLTDGVVTEIIPFTGESAGSPWWNETLAIAVTDPTGIVYVYGEVTPWVKTGDAVTRGQVIAFPLQVLKQDKGVNPPCMVHLETWTKDYQSNYTWKLGEPKPEGLINPLSILNFWVIKGDAGYKIETYNGKYLKYFDSAVDCKAYCMWRTDTHGEKFRYLNPGAGKWSADQSNILKDYIETTGKLLTRFDF